MGKAGRRKGAEGERAVARLFREAGWDVRGVQRGAADAGDLLATRAELNGARREPMAVALRTQAMNGPADERKGLIVAAELLEAEADVLRNVTLVLDSKRQERIRLLEWSRQVEGIARDGEAPCVVWRPSREPWRVSLRLGDLLGTLAP